jgi:predicted nuclease of predicted toxin-antitoxin system
VRILLDEQIPIGLAEALQEHRVDTVVSRGWAGVKNGELLQRMRNEYGALLTMDRGIEFQQNVSVLPFGVVLIRAPSNRVVHLQPLVPDILDALAAVKPGELRRVGV